MRVQQRTFFRDNPNATPAEIIAAGYRGFSRYAPPKAERQNMAYFPVDFSEIAWSDFETTNLIPQEGHPLEFCMMKTDKYLNIIATLHLTIAFDLDIWDRPVDMKVREMHSRSGLWDRCRESELFTADAAEQISGFLLAGWPHSHPRLGGLNPAFDRNWLRCWMPDAYAGLDYHNFEVRSIQDFLYSLGVDMPTIEQEDRHTARGDVAHMIETMRAACSLVERMMGRKMPAHEKPRFVIGPDYEDDATAGNAIDT